MTKQRDDEMPDAEFLRNLAERLMRIPVMYGTDQGDVDRLNRIARTLAPAKTPPVSGAGRFVVVRTARHNPAIKGLTVYLTPLGMWSLNSEYAWRFSSGQDAKDSGFVDDETRIEELGR